MYENTTHLQFQANMLDEGLLILRAYIVPILRKQPGLLSLALIPHPNLSQVTIISMWDSPDSARAVETVKEYRQEIQKLDEMMLHKTLYAHQTHSMLKIESGELSSN